MRILRRALLAVSGTLSVAICAIVLRRQGLTDASAWATVAAALAVLAAIVSAWTSQRQLELQEDAVEPVLLPAIDLRSRTNLAQFAITNHGGSHAYDVTLEWKRQLLGLDGEPIRLGLEPIPMIPKGESASVLITSSHELIRTNTDTTFTGTIRFKNARGRTFAEEFMVTAEHERAALALATDAQELKEDVRKIREALEKIATSTQKE